MNANLQNLIDKLVQRIDVVRIFKFSFPWEGKEQEQLLLVIHPVKGMAPKTLAPLVSLCMSDMDTMPFDLIIEGEWLNKIKQGSLYYTYVSLPQHQCYVAKKKPDVLFSSKNMAGLLELAQINYDKAREVSDEFRLGAENFLAKGEYGQATFMLHQFLETRLKAFQATAGINGGKGHNLEHIFKTLRTIAPRLQEIFPYDVLTEGLLRKLDESYTKAKKLEQVEITEEEFHILLEKCELAGVEMDSKVQLMVERITAYQNELAAKQGYEESTPPKVKAQKGAQPVPATTVIHEDFSDFPWPQQYKDDANNLLAKIRTNRNPEQVTMLNYHTGGFSGRNLFQDAGAEGEQGAKVELYLVVIMKNTGPFTFEIMQVGMASAMVLYMNLSYLERKLAEGDRFVNTVWTKGQVLRRKSSFEPTFAIAEVDWEREYGEMEDIINKTECFVADIRDNYDSLYGETSLSYCVLNSMLHGLIITYLKCAVGYVPKGVPLHYLSDWTGVVNRELIEYLHPKTDTERRQLYLLLRPEKLWTASKFEDLNAGALLDPENIRKILGHFQKMLEGELNQYRQRLHPNEAVVQQEMKQE